MQEENSTQNYFVKEEHKKENKVHSFCADGASQVVGAKKPMSPFVSHSIVILSGAGVGFAAAKIAKQKKTAPIIGFMSAGVLISYCIVAYLDMRAWNKIGKS